MTKLREAAANVDQLEGYPSIHFIHIGENEARLLVRATALKVVETDNGLELEGWVVARQQSLAESSENIEKYLLLAETLWASNESPVLRAVISADCLAETEKINAEDNRMVHRLAFLFQPNPTGSGGLIPQKTPAREPTPEEEEDFVTRGAWAAMLDLLGEFASYAFYHNDYADFAAHFPGLVVTSAEIEVGWPRLSGVWFGYWWNWTFQSDQGLLRLSVGKGDAGRLWTSVVSASALVPKDEQPKGTRLKNPTEPFRALVEKLEPSPFPYRFKPVGESTESQFTIAYGNTPEEAYASLSSLVGISSEAIALCFDPLPLNNDERVWPDEGLRDLLGEREVPQIPTIQMDPLLRYDFGDLGRW